MTGDRPDHAAHPVRGARPRATVSGEAKESDMSQLLLGRDAVVARIRAAVDRAGAAGGGVIVISGPAGVGTTAVVAEALRSQGSKVSRASAGPPARDVPVWWIDDAQRISVVDAERLADAVTARTIVLSGRRPLGARLAGLVRDALRADPGAVIDVEPLGTEVAAAVVDTADLKAARACDGRLRLLAAVSQSTVSQTADSAPATGDAAATAVQIAVEDLLEDLTIDARSLFDVIAVGGGSARIAAVEKVWESGAALDATLDELIDGGLVELDGGLIRPAVPIIATVTASHLGAARAVALHAAFAAALAGLPGVDARDIADHVRLASDRLPRDFSIGVLRASAARRVEVFDHVGALADLEVAGDLAEAAADGGTRDDRIRAFETLSSLAVARFYVGPLHQAEALLRRAERFGDVAPPSQREEIELYRAGIRSDSGRPAEIPMAAGAGEGPDHRAAVAVRQLFLADRGVDGEDLDAVCEKLIGLDTDTASPVGRGAAALGRSVRASLAGDFALAESEAEHGLALVADGPPEVFGGLARELMWLCTLRGDLDAAQRHADAGADWRAPRVVQASGVAHGASIALLRGDMVRAADLAERSLAMTRAAPVPRGLVRCAAWVALISAMRGDVTRARSLLAEAGRMFPLEANLLLTTIMQLARVQLALREGAGMPPPFTFRMERTEGPTRLLLPTLAGRLAIEHSDDQVLEASLAELDALTASAPAVALAQRVRALRGVAEGRRGDSLDALDDGAAALERLGFAGLAAETRLEWAELAAERGDAAARGVVLELVPYFDAQGLDDWGDRARRLARTIGVRIGGRRGGAGELTRRESEVVELVVAGLSNAEVARRLYLSERTVETHLQHVYRRLGVDSRQAMITRLSAVGEG
jgi:DNA-binding CsgD family transcriptional regulator